MKISFGYIFYTLLIISFLSSCKKDEDITYNYDRQLDIPARRQWDSDDGYCGEASLQMAALYYGNYISQDITRTLTGGWFLVGDEDALTLDKLSFTYEDWDFNKSSPQYKDHMVWIKQHLNNYHPVLITSYVKGMSYPDYDHIMIAVGFSATDLNSYEDTDLLIFNNCFDNTHNIRTFGSLWDKRRMSGNGDTYEYCIPKQVNFGCAITGIKDLQHETLPVHLSVDCWNEPDIIAGESAVLLNAIITVNSLISGQEYALLRYDNYSIVPSSGFHPAGASSVVYFTATGVYQTFSDTFMSDKAVFYRCIQYDF